MSRDQNIALEEQFAQKPMSKATFLRLAQFVRPYKTQFFLNVAFTILATASSLLGPKFIQIGIDRHLTNFNSPEIAVQGIFLISAVYLANLFLGWALSVAQVKTALTIGQGAMNDLRKAVFPTFKTFRSISSIAPAKVGLSVVRTVTSIHWTRS